MIIVGLLLMGVGLIGMAQFVGLDPRRAITFGEHTGEIIGQNLFLAIVGAVAAILGAVTTQNVTVQLGLSSHPSSCPAMSANVGTGSFGCADFAFAGG